MPSAPQDFFRSSQWCRMPLQSRSTALFEGNPSRSSSLKAWNGVMLTIIAYPSILALRAFLLNLKTILKTRYAQAPFIIFLWHMQLRCDGAWRLIIEQLELFLAHPRNTSFNHSCRTATVSANKIEKCRMKCYVLPGHSKSSNKLLAIPLHS